MLSAAFTILVAAAQADSAAFAALSPTQRSLLDVRRNLPDTALACVSLGTTTAGESRRRLQGRLPDGSSLVLFARTSAAGEVLRVEFVRTRRGVQRGITWDRDGNRAEGVDWNADRTRATRFPIPSGGPVPEVMRGLARRLVHRCG